MTYHEKHFLVRAGQRADRSSTNIDVLQVTSTLGQQATTYLGRVLHIFLLCLFLVGDNLLDLPAFISSVVQMMPCIVQIQCSSA